MNNSKEECEFIQNCPIFQKLSKETTKNVLLNYYCKGDFTKCKRYELKKSGQEAPANMMPNGTLF